MMHFLIALGVLAGLIAFAFGERAARTCVRIMLIFAVVLACAFTVFIAIVIQ